MASSQDEQKSKLVTGQDVPMTTVTDITDEELQLEQALRQLKLLHIKSRDLRTTIPRMLDTMATRGTPEQVFATFTAAVTAAQTEIKDFGTLYNSEESQKALDQARKSREAEPNGIKPWLHNDEPDWYSMDE